MFGKKKNNGFSIPVTQEEGRIFAVNSATLDGYEYSEEGIGKSFYETYINSTSLVDGNTSTKNVDEEMLQLQAFLWSILNQKEEGKRLSIQELKFTVEIFERRNCLTISVIRDGIFNKETEQFFQKFLQDPYSVSGEKIKYQVYREDDIETLVQMGETLENYSVGTIMQKKHHIKPIDVGHISFPEFLFMMIFSSFKILIGVGLIKLIIYMVPMVERMTLFNK